MAGLGLPSDPAPLSPTAAAAANGGDQRTSSVAELRRKAQEHSAALLQSLQHVASFQQAAGLNFPLLPPLTLQAALQRRHQEDEKAAAAAVLAAATADVNAAKESSTSS